MKKRSFIFLILPISYIGVSCNSNTVSVTIKTAHCTAESVTSAKKSNDLTIGFTPNGGYTLVRDNFKIVVGEDDISSKDDTWWTFNDNKLKIFKKCVSQNITISANATFVPTIYNLNVESNQYITPYSKEGFPSKASNIEDLSFKFKVNDGYGFDTSISIGNEIFNDYYLDSDSSGVFTLKIKAENIKGDIDIKFNTAPNKLTLSCNSINIKNYDTRSVKVLNPSGSINVNKDSDVFNVSVDGDKLIIDSLSDTVCEGKTITVTDSKKSGTINVSIYHPKDVEEALDSTTLGFIRDNQEFYLTFDYNNLEDFYSFASHLEITENYGKGLGADFSTGKNKQNKFGLIGISKHGRDYGYKNTSQESELFRPITNGAYSILHNSLDSSTSTLEIDNSLKTIKVYNSEELFWAVEHGYIPTFDSCSKAQTAKTIYEKGREIVKNETRDSMSVFDEIVAIFNYLENSITYDYPVTEISGDWVPYSSYFLEGVFLNNGVAVCDGFSKAFAFLCGLDSLPVIRSFGYTSDNSGHAWNYAKIYDSWYLICPTWALSPISTDTTDFYSKQFGVFDYGSFLKGNNYFYKEGETKFSDDAFPSIIRSSEDYSDNIYNELYVGKTSNTYYVTTTLDLSAILNACHNAKLDNKQFYVVFERSNDVKLDNLTSFIRSALKSSNLKCSSFGALYTTQGHTVYCMFK